jgi:hypothetical protein
MFERLPNRNFRYQFITHCILKGFTMKKLSSKVNLVASRVDSRTVRLVVTVASLVMFVLAAGAPNSVGGVGMQ